VKKISWLITLLAGASLALNFYFYRQLDHYQKIEGKFRVSEVLDGDTLVLDVGQAVRLANVDAPALDLCYGQEAKENLAKLILGKYIRIENPRRDNFGRTLAKVYLDDELINETMTKGGWVKYTSGGTPADEARERI
jgi:endonuclease YncB( thermonuclease family)